MGENINNLRYTGDTILLAEREELKSVMKVKGESEKAGLNLNIQRIKIMSSGSITSWQIDGGGAAQGNGKSDRFYFLGL